MVWFQCEDCGDTIKKPKLDAHFRQCRASRLSCIDCLAVFDRATVKFHTSCVTEHEKYAEGATKPGGYAAAGYTGGSAHGSGGSGATSSAGPVGLEHTTSRPPWKCLLCNVNCTSKENLLAHAASKKHRNKYKRVTSGANGENGAKENGNNSGAAESAAATTATGNGEKSPEKKKEEEELDEKIVEELEAWNKHTKKVMKKKGGQMALKKLGKLVVKRIVKKSRASKVSKGHRAAIEESWRRKLGKSCHFEVEGEDVVLKKIF
ncbi:C2H2-type domain-containing protein [Chloropicon primus]|uniref:C2H2-type domain-containing protein n=1 Tax=Chloropicon primus TaxID=1764295 RepID=A0A5B8MGR7_9CHLO|nr:hypothetical protein A3770_02p10600 [Chloropicon primus]UPQ97751.1 C2H2-type domain-containing protein [Chloropicon primus]|mmetsp:Transcript_10519/g.29727  ORF Transcript_10519/g.29727 Transcript_10519/m.29727 type:complete len:263 (-) Transcript_10519:2008-2796(-)|eukprot:QDZ18542.1 hypothetical protein A3770_02p10600 [Chloropicon primus]